MDRLPKAEPSPGAAHTPAVAPTSALKLSDIAYARIVASIANGDYAVGARLPTENMLAELLSVSRPVVREALSRLRDDGLVFSRRGSGTYVRRAAAVTDQSLAPLSSIADMRRCLVFRRSVEGENAYYAALSLTPEGGAALAHALQRLEAAARSGEIGVDDDLNLHMAVARATENRFFASAMASMREPITAGMNITRHFALLRTQERLLELHNEHVRIVEAILARDPEAAREAMWAHLDSAIQRAFEGAA